MSEAHRLVDTRTVSYLPTPNVVETYICPWSWTPEMAELITTAFVFPFFADGRLVLTHNRRRGIEVPGGHIEPGETPWAAAKREVKEETGYVVLDLVPVGYLKMTINAEKPEGYKYPYPVSYQQFFASRLDHRTQDDYIPNDECLQPIILHSKRILTNSVSPFSDSHRLLFLEAHKTIFGDRQWPNLLTRLLWWLDK